MSNDLSLTTPWYGEANLTPTHSLDRASLARPCDPHTSGVYRSGWPRTRPLLRRGWNFSPAASPSTSLERKLSDLAKDSLLT